MDAALPVEILALKSGIPEEPTANQQVRLGIDRESRLTVADPAGVVTPDAVGTERRVALSTIHAKLAHHPEADTGIVTDGGRPTFRGIVVTHGGEESSDALVDVGAGTVRFDPADADDRIHVGEFVELREGAVRIDAMEPDGAPYETYLDRLETGGPATRREAAAYLGRVGRERAVDPLVERFESDDRPGVRRAVVVALGRIGLATRPPGESPDPRIRSTLEAATGDEHADVRTAADQWLDRVETQWRT